MIVVVHDLNDLVVIELRDRVSRLCCRVSALHPNTDRFFSTYIADLLPDCMLDSSHLHRTSDDLTRVQRLTECPEVRMEESFATVRRPAGREFLFQHEPDVLGPHTRLGAQNDLDLQRNEDRWSYLEVLPDQPHGVEIIRDRLSQLVRKFVCTDGIDGHAHGAPASGPRISCRRTRHSLDLLRSRHIVGERYRAKLSGAVRFGNATYDLGDRFAVDTVRNIEWIPATAKCERRRGGVGRYTQGIETHDTVKPDISIKRKSVLIRANND